MNRREALAFGAIGLSGVGFLGATGTAEASDSPTARLAGPIQVPVNEKVVFDASKSTAVGGEIAEYRWITPDGGKGQLDKSGETITYEFSETGDNGMQVSVEDENGNTDFEALRIEVIENGPVPALNGPDAVEAGESASVSVDFDRTDVSEIVDYEWTVTRESDGKTIAEASGPDELGIDFAPEEQRTYYTVEGVFVNDAGVKAIGTHILETAPHPIAKLDGATKVPVNEPVTFDARRSTHSDSSTEIVEYHWSAQHTGELNKSGATVTHEFTETGDTGVQVTVEDENGHTDSEAIRVEVTEDGPVPALNGSDAVDVGESTSVGIDFSRVDPSTIDTYEWTVTRESDGKTIAEASGSDELDISFTPEQHTYYTVEGVFTDETGVEGIGTHVLIAAPHPVAKLDGPQEVTVGEEVTFDASGSRHDDGTIEEYRWYVQNEGELNENGDTLTYTFTETGYTGVEVTVEDENGYTDSEAMRVNVTSN